MRCDLMTVEQVKKLLLWDKKSKSHLRWDWAVSYLALGDSQGLNPELFDLAMDICKAHKMNLVNFLIGKPIKGEANKVHDKVTATAVADAIFKNKYEAEVKAHNSPTINTYWTREVGGLEYGELEVDKLGRLEAEDQPIFELKREWTPKSRMKRNMGQLLSYLAQGKDPAKVIRNARRLMWNFAISKEQFESLVEMAGPIHTQATKNVEVEL